LISGKQRIPLKLRSALCIKELIGIAPLASSSTGSGRGQIDVKWNYVLPQNHIQCNTVPNILRCIFYSHSGCWPCCSDELKVQGLDDAMLDFEPRPLTKNQRIVGNLVGPLSGLRGSSHFMKLSSGEIGIEPSDDDQHHRAKGFDTLWPIGLFLVAAMAACGVVYSGVCAFDGGWKVLYIPLGLFLLWITFRLIHIGLFLLGA